MDDKFILKLFMGLVVLGYSSFLIWGKQEVKSYLILKQDINKEILLLSKLDTKLVSLKQQIDKWENDKFLLEKELRQELLLGLPQETVYIIN